MSDSHETRMASAKIREFLNNRRRITPDLPFLNKRGIVPLFAYGWEKQEKALGWVLKDAEFYGEAVTYEETFIVKKPDRYGISISRQFPIAFEYPKLSIVGSGAIWGELYGVTPMMIHALDQYLFRGSRTERVIKDIDLISNQATDGMTVPAFIYLGDHKVYDTVRSTPIEKVSKTVSEAGYEYAIEGFHY